MPPRRRLAIKLWGNSEYQYKELITSTMPSFNNLQKGLPNNYEHLMWVLIAHTTVGKPDHMG